MAQQQSANVFAALHKWARHHEENFVTEAFVQVLLYLLNNDRDSAVSLISQLTNGLLRVGTDELSDVIFSTQAATDYGYPDIRLRFRDFYLLLEVKVECAVSQDQLWRYRQELLQSGAATTLLVLITKYKEILDSARELPDHWIRWSDIANWFDEEIDSGRLQSDVGRYLANQFVAFLRSRSIAIRPLSEELELWTDGLLRLAEQALGELQHTTRPQQLDYCVGHYVEQAKYWVGFYHNEPRRLWFETTKFKLNASARDLSEIGGEIVWTGWKGTWAAFPQKWRKSLDFSKSMKEFLALPQSQQHDQIKAFISRCLDDASKIELLT